MQAADKTTINHSFNRDDMVNFVPFRTVGVDGQERVFANPLRSAKFNVFSAEVESRRIIGIVRPPFAPRLVNSLVASIVASLFLSSDALAIGSIGLVPIDPPCVLSLQVSTEVSTGLRFAVGERTGFALVTDGKPLGVVGRARFADAADRADFESERLRTALHNSDIVALVGDVKPRELREKRVTPIRSQATQECVEGSETRAWSPDRTVKPHERAAPQGDEIVRPVQLNAQKREIKNLRGNNVTTIQNRSGELADNLTNNNALLRKLKAKGNVRPFGGGNVILEEIMYTDSASITANSYSGYETINVGQNSPISAAQFSITQYAGSVTMSGLEMLQNSSKEQIIDLMEGRMKVAEGQLLNRIDYDLYQDGTGNAGKNLTGLGLAVPDTPTSGTYGGISRSTWTFWQSQSYSGATDGGAAVSAANIQAYMTTLGLSLVRGTDKPDCWIADSTYFAFYVNSMQAIQRVSSDGSETVGAGFPTLKFYGGGMAADVYMGSGVNGPVNIAGTAGGATAAHMWALNTNYIFFRPHRDRNFVPIGGERQSVNQDAIVKLIGWAGNMTSSGPQFCGVLIA